MILLGSWGFRAIGTNLGYHAEHLAWPDAALNCGGPEQVRAPAAHAAMGGRQIQAKVSQPFLGVRAAAILHCRLRVP